MSDELSTLNLKDDFEEASSTNDASRWVLNMPGDLEVTAIMRPEKFPTEQFQASLRWNKYPDEPPSLKFRDPATGRIDIPQSWPIIRGFRPQSLDACVNWCLEGFALHPEWRTDPRFRWDSSHDPLLRVLRTLQDEFDDEYQGRFK
jgi:hypothetical protein